MGYKARISQTKEQRAEGAVALAVLEAKSSVEQVISTEKLKLARLGGVETSLLSAEPFNIEKVLAVKAEITVAKARLDAATAILSSEFAD